MTSATVRRRIPAQSQQETSEWQERDLRDLSIEAQRAVAIGLTRVLAALKRRERSSPRRAAKRRRANAPPYHLFDLPVDDPTL
jgi:hypothetical protein